MNRRVANRTPKTSRAKGGISLSIVAGVSSLVAGIVLLPFVILEVGPTSYGVWLVLSAASAYLYYSDVGLGAAISHFGARGRGGGTGPRLQSLLLTGLTWNTVAGILLAPVYFIFAVWYISTEGDSLSIQDKEILPFIALGLLLPLLLRPFGAALIGAGFLTIERRNQVVGVLVRVSGTLLICANDGGIVGVALVEMASLSVPSLLAIVSLRRRGYLSFKAGDLSVGTVRLMLGFSFKSFGVSFIGAMTLQSGMLIVGLVGSAADATFYNAAYRIYSSVRQLLSWTIDPFRPGLSRLFAVGREQANQVLFAVLLVSFGVGAAACTSLMIMSSDFIDLWLGDTVPHGEVVLATQILLLGLLINMVHIPLAPATDAAGKPGALFKGQLTWFLLCIGISILATSKYGFVGAALGLSLPLLVVEPYMIALGMKALRVKQSMWFTRVCLPVAVTWVSALVPTLGVALILRSLSVPYVYIIAGAVFVLFSAAATAIFSKKFGLWEGLKRLNIEL